MNSSELELLGRLLLWDTAVMDTHQLLKLSQRANLGSIQDNIRNEIDNFHKAQAEFKSTIPKETDWRVARDMEIIFSQSYTRAFPTWEECIKIEDACIALAIVFFCQLLTSGNPAPGAAAKNDKNFLDIHLDAIIKRVFPNVSEQEKFSAFCEQLRYSRNKMLAHADGSAFQINHGSTVTSMKLRYVAWENIDIEYWLSFMDPLRLEILNYYNENKKSFENKQS